MFSFFFLFTLSCYVLPVKRLMTYFALVSFLVLLVFNYLSNFSSSCSSIELLYIDNVSLLLVYITSFVMLTSLFSHQFADLDLVPMFFTFLGLTLSSLVVFSANNLFILYLAYEASLVPISYAIIK